MKEKLAKLPKTPGVYYFKKGKEILYIGRATSLRDRAKSYFSKDLITTRGQLLVDMILTADDVDFVKTDTVLEAIILESNEIKKHFPFFNTKEKNNKSYNYVVITDEEYPRLVIVRERNIPTLEKKPKYIFGPFTNDSLLREALKIIRRIFPYRDAKANIKYNESFYQSIGLSPEKNEEYKKTIRNLVMFFQGKKKLLIKTLEKEMKTYIKELNFEMAKVNRDTIYALKHIQDISLLKKDIIKPAVAFRIEAFDVAHMGGKNNVGVMTVIENGQVQKAEYRKFKISIDKNNDTFAIREVLRRRFNHPEWNFPNFIVIDGGVAQLNAAKEIVTEIPIVSVVKDSRHKAAEILGDKKIIDIYESLILLANSEAHRFAIAYHKKLRSKQFLGYN